MVDVCVILQRRTCAYRSVHKLYSCSKTSTSNLIFIWVVQYRCSSMTIYQSVTPSEQISPGRGLAHGIVSTYTLNREYLS